MRCSAFRAVELSPNFVSLKAVKLTDDRCVLHQYKFVIWPSLAGGGGARGAIVACMFVRSFRVDLHACNLTHHKKLAAQ